MIITEELEGNLVRTFSDKGMKIERGGVRYCEAIDPKSKGRTYTETDEPVASEDVSDADKDAVLRKFGVEV